MDLCLWKYCSADSDVTHSQIDIKAVERELEIAREQLQQKQSLIEYNLSSASMARAMARLSGARKLTDIR